jgi:hypothetical protein
MTALHQCDFSVMSDWLIWMGEWSDAKRKDSGKRDECPSIEKASGPSGLDESQFAESRCQMKDCCARMIQFQSMPRSLKTVQ